MIEIKALAFLREFSRLAPKHQQIYLWCIEHCPFPRPYTGDFGDIAIGTGSSRRTVCYAMRAIERTKLLSTTVRVVRINPKEALYASITENRAEALDDDAP